jgi:hypothetical protein
MKEDRMDLRTTDAEFRAAGVPGAAILGGGATASTTTARRWSRHAGDPADQPEQSGGLYG